MNRPTPDAYAVLLDLCQNRRSVRSFADTPVPEELLAQIRAVAKTSPYASGKNNWELIVLTDRSLIADLGRIVRARCSELSLRVVGDDFRKGFLDYAENFAAFESAPALLVPTFGVRNSLSLMLDAQDEDIQRWERDAFVKSISCVCMLTLLAAQALGLGACYMTGPLVAEPELARRIGVRRGQSLAALIPVGYPA